MDSSGEKKRKRDIVKNGIDRAASKLGISSSHAQEASSHRHEASSSMRDAIASSVTSSLSMTPAFSQGHKDTHYPETPQQDTGMQGEHRDRPRAPMTPYQVGDKSTTTSIRITSFPKRKKDGNKDTSATKVQTTVAGGTVGGTSGVTSGGTSGGTSGKTSGGTSGKTSGGSSGKTGGGTSGKN